MSLRLQDSLPMRWTRLGRCRVQITQNDRVVVNMTETGCKQKFPLTIPGNPSQSRVSRAVSFLALHKAKHFVLWKRFWERTARKSFASQHNFRKKGQEPLANCAWVRTRNAVMLSVWLYGKGSILCECEPIFSHHHSFESLLRSMHSLETLINAPTGAKTRTDIGQAMKNATAENIAE